MEVLGCNQDDIACMSPGCKWCQDALQGLRATVAEETLGHNRVYNQWIRDDDGQTKRLSTQVTVEDGLGELVRIVPDLLFHCCIKPEQARYCQHLLASPDHYTCYRSTSVKTLLSTGKMPSKQTTGLALQLPSTLLWAGFQQVKAQKLVEARSQFPWWLYLTTTTMISSQCIQ